MFSFIPFLSIITIMSIIVLLYIFTIALLVNYLSHSKLQALHTASSLQNFCPKAFLKLLFLAFFSPTYNTSLYHS